MTTDALTFLLPAAALLGFSGVPAALGSARSAAGQRLTTGLVVAGSLLGLAGVAAALVSPAVAERSLAWGVPQSRFAVAADPLAVLFLLPVMLVPMLGSLYGLGYWKQAAHPASGRRLGLFYGLLAGAMALVVLARDGVLFLIAWEVMALAAYFAATAEDDRPEVRRAGWVYLVATHTGTLALLALFAAWRHHTGSFLLEPGRLLPADAADLMFVLALVGFGFKAGLMPLHLWLPGAHANAPSHVSAVMSGVMLKMGVYGLVRMTALLPAGAAWWGPVVLMVGALTSMAGMALAIGQRDLKRLLAYSSIENMGVVALGLGLALLGRSRGQGEWVLLGLGGALLHVWNHSLFKSLLFFNAGAILHAAGTREIDRMGGLAHRLPRVMGLFVAGAAAICALPPLNGFAGEWMLYTGFLRTLGPGVEAPAAALAAVALAATGALAAACFVKVLGAVFLGVPRGPASAPVHEPGACLWAPMAALAAGCVVLGLFPALAAPVIEAAARTWSPASPPLSLAALLPFRALTAAGLALTALAGLGMLALNRRLRTAEVRPGPTWDCGYARPAGRMQYTGSSFGNTLAGLASFLLRPTQHRPNLRALFPPPSAFRRRVPDPVLDRMVLPLFRMCGRILTHWRVLQQGRTHVYVLYILLTMIALLVWGSMGGRGL